MENKVLQSIEMLETALEDKLRELKGADHEEESKE